MKRLLILAALCVASLAHAQTVITQAALQANPCANPAAVLQSVTGVTTAASTTQIIALSGITKIFVCSVNITSDSAVAASTVSLEYGTGSNCATSPVVFYGPLSTATLSQNYAVNGSFFVSPAGQAVCYVTVGVASTQNYTISYVQL